MVPIVSEVVFKVAVVKVEVAHLECADRRFYGLQYHSEIKKIVVHAMNKTLTDIEQLVPDLTHPTTHVVNFDIYLTPTTHQQESWIEARNWCHKFYVGDTFHPRLHEIHKELDQLVTDIK
ncbi:hypothetical protein Tco_0850034 [Tanacetum coccineum]